jgi:outer membrane receptor protein involved in Fe transport
VTRGFTSVLSCAIAFSAAPASARPVELRVPPGALGDAAIAIGRQAGISISISDPVLSRQPVPGFRGRMSAERALNKLVRGKAAEVVKLGAGAFRIDAATPPKSRPPRREKAEPRSRANPSEEEPILVVATKRRMLPREVPGSLTVIDLGRVGAAVRSGGSEILVGLDSALGSTHFGPGRNKLFIRGIADSSFNGQTQGTVGEYLGEARLNYNAIDPDLRLYDIRSVEILPGPQGTLYGAGTIGGVVRLDPVEPRFDCLCGSIETAAGATAHGAPGGEMAGVLNLPLAQGSAAVRAVAYGIVDGGYIATVLRHERDVNRVRTVGGRATGRIEFSPGVTMSVMFAGQRINAADSQYADRDIGPLKRSMPVAEPFTSRFLLGNAVLEASSGPYHMVATASAVRQRLTEEFGAAHDDRLLILGQRNGTALQSGELRVSRNWPAGGGWLAGISLLHNRRVRGGLEIDPRPLASHPDLHNRLSEATAFAELTYTLSSRLEATIGGRATSVRSEGNLEGEARIGTAEFHFMPSTLLSLRLAPNARLFARVEESFRPGGYVLRSGRQLHLDSDRVRSWEVGLRFDQASGRRFSGGISASFSHWARVQVDLIDDDGFPTTTNFGDGRVLTLDGHLEAALSPGLLLALGATRNRSRMTSPRVTLVPADPVPLFVPPNPAPLPNVPGFSVQASLRSARTLARGRQLKLAGWLRYVGKSTLGIGPKLDRRQGNYLDTGIEADLVLSRTTLFASLTNLLDSKGNRFALGSLLASGRMDQVTPMRPRTLRLGASIAF